MTKEASVNSLSYVFWSLLGSIVAQLYDISLGFSHKTLNLWDSTAPFIKKSNYCNNPVPNVLATNLKQEVLVSLRLTQIIIKFIYPILSSRRSVLSTSAVMNFLLCSLLDDKMLINISLLISYVFLHFFFFGLY